MDIIATYLAKEFLKRKLIKEDALEWCIYGIGKRLSTLITGVLLIVSGSYHFWFPSSDIFCYWLCYIKKIYEWVSCRNLYSLFGAFIISPINLHGSRQIPQCRFFYSHLDSF